MAQSSEAAVGRPQLRRETGTTIRTTGCPSDSSFDPRRDDRTAIVLETERTARRSIRSSTAAE
ncbi:hypothetical protein CP556_11425 [Natrinema sp. CBA1119]|nr:hypothetical protein CP556_11425 [Natrinema sp. CBA1119]